MIPRPTAIPSNLSAGSLGSSQNTQKTQTVDELSSRIRETITSAPALRNLAVRGELQNFKRHTSGHVYFTLMGNESRISAVLFRSHASGVLAWPADGDEVVVTGSVDVYPKGGAYQLYATRILPIGLGAQARAKAELQSALEREGLFDVRHKRPIPVHPAKVAVITSPTGAAVQDILKVSGARAPFIDIVVLPALVQGVDAPGQIAAALARAGRLAGVECAILARGGGARDDLSPFDDERVVRAVRSCPVPVVTGVGHQIDNSLADLAADVALPTPSAAAECVFPDSREVRQKLSHALHALSSAAVRHNTQELRFLERASDRLGMLAGARVSAQEGVLKEVLRRLDFGVSRKLERCEALLTALAASLDALSPLAVLGRGYTICRDERGSVVKSAASLGEEDKITLQFVDGRVGALVQTVRRENV